MKLNTVLENDVQNESNKSEKSCAAEYKESICDEANESDKTKSLTITKAKSVGKREMNLPKFLY